MLFCFAFAGIHFFRPFSHAVGIGFYNPTGVDPEFAEKVDFSMLEVINEAQVLDALAEAKRANLQLTLNIGPVITEPLPVDQVNISYVADDENRTKRLLPRPKHKLKRFVSDEKIAHVVERLALAMRAYPGVIDTIFLIDEPYLSRISGLSE